MLQNTIMKIIQSKKIDAFGGLNFVHDLLEQIGITSLLESGLPVLPSQVHINGMISLVLF